MEVWDFQTKLKIYLDKLIFAKISKIMWLTYTSGETFWITGSKNNSDWIIFEMNAQA